MAFCFVFQVREIVASLVSGVFVLAVLSTALVSCCELRVSCTQDMPISFFWRALKDHNPPSEGCTARSLFCRDILSGSSHGIPTLQGVLGPSACAFCMTSKLQQKQLSRKERSRFQLHMLGQRAPFCRRARYLWHFGELRMLHNSFIIASKKAGMDGRSLGLDLTPWLHGTMPL